MRQPLELGQQILPRFLRKGVSLSLVVGYFESNLA